MRKLIFILMSGCAAGTVLAESPALTIYNQNFAVVRDSLHLDLKAGVNEVSYHDAAMYLEPDSVVLRDPSGKHALQILEQNFRADPISQSLLLNYYEGKTIEFESAGDKGAKKIIHGKIVRSGYRPYRPDLGPFNQGGDGVPDNGNSPIVEVDGKLMFHLPGEPLFPALPDDTILKPTLAWQLNANEGGSFDAELGYVTQGIKWEAAYNLVAPEKGDTLDVVGWVTIDNHTGKSFSQAKIKLMAGDVRKIQADMEAPQGAVFSMLAAPSSPVVTEKSFDDYHLYTLQRPTTLLDRETKQVEFVRAEGIKSEPLYVYVGARINRGRMDDENIRSQRNYGTQFNSKIAVMREFKNSITNHLGIPLPKGRLRFYRRDDDGQLEFTGEDTIDHTPRDETIRVTTGDAFDLVGERRRTAIHQENAKKELNESFVIKLRNHKKEAVKIQMVEHLYRARNWDVTEKSGDYEKVDDRTIKFSVPVKPDAEQTVSYTVHYTW